MPQALATILVPWISNILIGIGLPGLAFGATVGAIALGASYLLLAGAAYLVSQAFKPPTPEAPKPEDGKYNLKQTVPPLVYVLGQVKKAGDYVFLEERGGTAYHITVIAAHKILGIQSYWLHDEQVTIDGSGFVISPEHFGGNVRIEARVGDAASTAYDEIVAVFPEIWTEDHRGDGLATMFMGVRSVASEDLQKTYPSGMPQQQATIWGHSEIFDPRTGTKGFTQNIALFRLWHLTHPVGGKLSIDDMYLPDWIAAANVCDQPVITRTGAIQSRYFGGLWFRANNDPVQVGRLMDQAADMVLYERPDGKVGVHPGAFVEPDIRLTANDIISIRYDPNKRRGSNVLAVRGRYTDPGKGFNTTDAAIYGEPYPSEDERTKTVDNQAVQSHNHVARLQKLAYIRANAPRVTITAHFDPARNVPYRRFVKVHYPPKMTEAIVEITGRPTLSLRSLTCEFEGIVVPPDLYAFDAATEEGEPGANVLPIEREDVPVPVFNVTIQREVVGGGSSAAFGLAAFTPANAAFQYELEWQPTSGGPTSSVMGDVGATSVRSSYLADGTEYRFRMRAWSSGAPSDWTAYQVLTATADPVAPGVASSVSAAGGAGQVTFNWTAPNSANYVGARLYLNTTNSMTGATLVALEYGPPNVVDSRVVASIPAGTWYGFVVAVNGSGIGAAPVATGSITVT